MSITTAKTKAIKNMTVNAQDCTDVFPSAFVVKMQSNGFMVNVIDLRGNKFPRR